MALNLREEISWIISRLIRRLVQVRRFTPTWLNVGRNQHSGLAQTGLRGELNASRGDAAAIAGCQVGELTISMPGSRQLHNRSGRTVCNLTEFALRHIPTMTSTLTRSRLWCMENFQVG